MTNYPNQNHRYVTDQRRPYDSAYPQKPHIDAKLGDSDMFAWAHSGEPFPPPGWTQGGEPVPRLLGEAACGKYRRIIEHDYRENTDPVPQRVDRDMPIWLRALIILGIGAALTCLIVLVAMELWS